MRTIVEYCIPGVLCLTFIENKIDVIDSLTFFSLMSSLAVGLIGLIVAVIYPFRKVRLTHIDIILLGLILYTIIKYSIQNDFYILNEKFLLTVGMFLYYIVVRVVKPNPNNIYISCSPVYCKYSDGNS